MRLEDLDGPRVRPGAAAGIYEDTRWLGLGWDEGPELAGPVGPYEQSARGTQYEAALDRLVELGLAYACTCTRKEVAVSSAPHGPQGAQYPGTCREGPTHPERSPAWRFRLDDVAPGFTDALAGEVPPIHAGDFVLRRSDGLFAYQLAVVVDDALMGVSEVVRGDDLLLSTPLQIAIYRALSYPIPDFLHVSLVLGSDGARLSKRHQSTAIADYRAAGWSSEEVIGLLACSLGLREDASPISAAGLVDDFSLDRVSLDTWQVPEFMPR
jgi:glutamyl-tRNA synthetase